MISDKIDTADTIYMYGRVMVTIPGDVNGDRVVDASNFFDLGKNYGKTC